MEWNLRVLLVDFWFLQIINIFPLMDLSFFSDSLFPGKCWKHHFCAFHHQLVYTDIYQGPMSIHPRNHPRRRQSIALTTAWFQSVAFVESWQIHLCVLSAYISQVSWIVRLDHAILWVLTGYLITFSLLESKLVKLSKEQLRIGTLFPRLYILSSNCSWLVNVSAE